MATPDPGLDRHAWESEFASIEPDLHDDPVGALPDLADLVRRMLGERGFDLEDPEALEGDEREIVDSYRSASEVAQRVDAGEDVDPGDVANAINELKAIYDTIVAERAAP